MGSERAARSPATAAILSRTVAALVGGYGFVWGFVTLFIALGLALGLPYGEVQTASFLLAFLVFVVAFCWAFATASHLKAWLVLAGGGLVMTSAGWLLANGLTP